MDTDLKGKGVLVTGGAGGIGTATVRAFAEEGARVVVHYRTREEPALALAKDVGGVALRADLTLEAEVDALIPQAVKELGRLDVVVANAGHWPPVDEPVWQMSLSRWRQTMAENLDSVFLTCRAFLRHVATTGTGSLVIVSSTAAGSSTPTISSFHMSMTALEPATRKLAAAPREPGLIVSCS